MVILSRRRLVPALAAFAVAAAFAVLLAGCAGTTGSERVTDYRGEPKGVEAPPSSAGGSPWAAWLEGGDKLAITLYGSSGCPPVVEDLDVTDNEVDVQVKQYPADRVCTMDYVPHTSVFRTPSELDRGQPVEFTADDVMFTLAPLAP